MKCLHMQLVILAGLLAAISALDAADTVSLRVTPNVAYAPATVSITVTVEPDGQNRALLVEADSAAYYRSSQIQLDGEHAARTHRLLFRGLPPGEHVVSAVVRGTNGSQARVSQKVMVVGP